jgi:hypothetical protein
VVTVTAEAGAAIAVTFTGTVGTVTKSLTGTGAAQAVQLTAGDLPTLGQGAVGVSAVQTDPAGNASPAGTASFVLDTVIPATPVLVLGPGVAGGATAAEATQPAGVVTVAGETGAIVYVTFVGTTNGGGDANKIVTKAVTGQGANVPVAVTLAPADLAKLTDGLVYAVSTQVNVAGNQSPNTVVSFALDSLAPAAPVLALGPGVAGGATAAEATQAAGVVTVTAEADAAIAVTFKGTAGTVTKSLTGTGAAQAVQLTAGDLTTLGQGAVGVSAVQTDPAGNQSPAGTASFVLDTVIPATPVIVLGTGVAGGATAAEATQAAGVLTVTGEAGLPMVVTLKGTAGEIVRTVTGQGATPVKIVLAAADLTTLGNGVVTVTASGSDAAGNSSPVGGASFPLDTVRPRIQSFATVPASGTFGPGAVIQLVATVSEDVPQGAAVNVVLNTGVSVRLAAAAQGRQLVGSYTVAPGQAAAPLRFTSYSTAGLADLAGNPLDASISLATTTGVTIAAGVRATATGFSSDPTRIPDLRVAVTSVPIVFNTPVTGLTLNSFRLTRDGRPVALTGARLTGSGANWTLTLPSTLTNPTGIYTLTILATGIRAASNGAPMTANSAIYWGKGKSVGPTVVALAFAGL